jgi:hypothetical protein
MDSKVLLEELGRAHPNSRLRPVEKPEPGSKDAVDAFRERTLNDPIYRAVFEQMEALEAMGGLQLVDARLEDIDKLHPTISALDLPENRGVNMVLRFRLGR